MATTEATTDSEDSTESSQQTDAQSVESDVEIETAQQRLEEAINRRDINVVKTSATFDFRVEVDYRDSIGFVLGSSCIEPMREAGFEIVSIQTHLPNAEHPDRKPRLDVLVDEK